MPPDQDQPDTQPGPVPESGQGEELPAPSEEEKAPPQSPPTPAPTSPSASLSGKEKRQSVRHNVRWRCLLLMGAGKKLPAMVVDFSDGGMSLITNFAIADKTRLDAALFIPDAKNRGTYLISNVTFEIIYHVLSRQDFKFGVKFIKPSSELLDRAHAAIRLGKS